MNIFQISQELQDIYTELEENGGELTDELEAKLAVSESDFKSKVKSYGEVIKSIDAEIDLIDKEVARLKELKESKNKVIERLKNVIIWAIDMYGDTTKFGGKFVDYGTGKISIRNTEKVEVNTDTTDTVVKSFFEYIRACTFSKELDYAESVDSKEVLNFLNDYVKINEEEFNNVQASISFDINLKDLITSKGLSFVKSFYDTVEGYKAKSNVSKTILKPILKEGNTDLHNIAELVNNKTVTIK